MIADSLKITLGGIAAHAAAVPDSLKTPTEKFLAHFSNMTIPEIIDAIIRWSLRTFWSLMAALLIWWIGRWIIRKALKLVDRLTARHQADASLAGFIRSLVSIILYTFLALCIIGELGFQTTSLVALLASAGVAIGMALGGTLQNFAGGFIILVLKPFKLGDYILAQGVEGTVKAIRMFHTELNTPDNKIILLPNGPLSTGSVVNYSRAPMRRVEWIVSIAYGDSFDDAKAALLDLFAQDARILQDPAPLVYLKEMADSCLKLTARAWCKTEDYWDVFFENNSKIHDKLEKSGLHFPFPQLDIHVKR